MGPRLSGLSVLGVGCPLTLRDRSSSCPQGQATMQNSRERKNNLGGSGKGSKFFYYLKYCCQYLFILAHCKVASIKDTAIEAARKGRVSDPG